MACKPSEEEPAEKLITKDITSGSSPVCKTPSTNTVLPTPDSPINRIQEFFSISFSKTYRLRTVSTVGTVISWNSFLMFFIQFPLSFVSQATQSLFSKSMKYSNTVFVWGNIASISRITLSMFLRLFSSTVQQTDQIKEKTNHFSVQAKKSSRDSSSPFSRFLVHSSNNQVKERMQAFSLVATSS